MSPRNLKFSQFLAIRYEKCFSRTMEYNMRNIFLEKLYAKCDGETSPGPFFEKLKLNISKFLCSLFLFYAKLGAIEIYLN